MTIQTFLIWNAIGSLDVGAEFVYGWVEEKSGADADAHRAAPGQHAGGARQEGGDVAQVGERLRVHADGHHHDGGDAEGSAESGGHSSL